MDGGDEQGRNAAGGIVHHDKYGTPYVLDKAGNQRPPWQAEVDLAAVEFTIYGDSRGHCGLCGRLGCRGGCFR